MFSSKQSHKIIENINNKHLALNSRRVNFSYSVKDFINFEIIVNRIKNTNTIYPYDGDYNVKNLIIQFLGPNPHSKPYIVSPVDIHPASPLGTITIPHYIEFNDYNHYKFIKNYNGLDKLIKSAYDDKACKVRRLDIKFIDEETESEALESEEEIIKKAFKLQLGHYLHHYLYYCKVKELNKIKKEKNYKIKYFSKMKKKEKAKAILKEIIKKTEDNLQYKIYKRFISIEKLKGTDTPCDLYTKISIIKFNNEYMPELEPLEIILNYLEVYNINDTLSIKDNIQWIEDNPITIEDWSVEYADGVIWDNGKVSQTICWSHIEYHLLGTKHKTYYNTNANLKDRLLY